MGAKGAFEGQRCDLIKLVDRSYELGSIGLPRSSVGSVANNDQALSTGLLISDRQ